MFRDVPSFRAIGSVCLLAAAIGACGPALGQEEPRAAARDDNAKLAFVSSGQGAYTFDTGVLRGTLRQGGKAQGLSSVVHVPSGARLDASLGLMSHYRVFTRNRRYGTAAWDWPSTSKLLPDGAVHVAWPEAADRPFAMTATYRWMDPQTLDVATTVTAREDLSRFESFLAAYFDRAFPSPRVYVADSREAAGKPGFLPARKSYGDWQMFPRDTDSVPIIRDGRWEKEPHPVTWTIMPHLAAPVCLRRNGAANLTAVLMSPPNDCFAIATPYEGEGHYSLYLSLFGRDIKAGQTATARARMVIAPAIPDDAVLVLYRRYLRGLSKLSSQVARQRR
jgi:hypothetical protein